MVNNPSRQREFSLTMPHLYDTMSFLVPIGVPYTSLQKIYLPFSLPVWLWLLSAYGIAFLFSLLRMHSSMSFFNITSIILGGGVGDEPQQFNARFLLLVWMSTTLILRNAYLGVLFDLLTGQVHHQPVDTFARIKQFNYTFYATPYVTSLMRDIFPALQDKLSQSICMRFHCLFSALNLSLIRFSIVSNDGATHRFASLNNESFQGVYGTDSLRSGYYNYVHRRENVNPVVLSKDKMIMAQFVMVLPKQSCLRTPFNRILEKFLSSGLIELWKTQNTLYTFDVPPKQPEVMNMSQLIGAFHICGFLYAIAFVVLALEILVARYTRVN